MSVTTRTIRVASERPITGLRIGALAVAACFAAGVQANPANPTVVNGSASFNTAGKVLTVTNTPGAVINWNTFSIGAGETTRFIQASASSSVLNRVLANDPSVIYGTLSSNGKVWLVNPAGIMVGAGGVVDVAGFVASTLNVSNADFLAGRKLFEGTPGAGSVVNQGSIVTPSGGSVYLIAPNVTNEGIIRSPQGEVILAAGQRVELIDSGTPGVKVEITGADGKATNLGEVVAEAGRIGMAGVLVRNAGFINASSVVSDGGRVFLKAIGDTLVEGGRLEARSDYGQGGRIDVFGDRVAILGDARVDTSGATGGGTIRIGGDYQGRNPDVPNARISYVGAATVLRADATEVGAGGTAIVWADDTTRAHGSISARGAGGGSGGFVETSGKNFLDVGGIRVDSGGGTWLLDPTDITVVHSGSPGGATFAGGIFVNGGGAAATINDYDINTNLAGNDIVITTSGGGGGTGDIKFDASAGAGGAIVIANTSGNRNLTLDADNDIIFTGGSTTFTAGSSSPLDIGFNPGAGRKVEIQAGASAIFDGTDGASPIRAAIKGASGKSWENYGTVTLVGNSYIDLNRDAGITSTFNNNIGGVLNLNSTQGSAIQSEPVNQAEAINNAGTINVNATTALEAKFSQTSSGILNINGSASLNMQHLDVAAGTINLNSAASYALTLPSQFSGLSKFDGASIVGVGGPMRMQIGTSGSTSNTVNFNNVSTSGGLGVNVPELGTLNFTGANTFANTKFYKGDAGANKNWVVPVATYLGNVEWWATGNISFAGNVSFGGAVTLGAGWDSNIGTPAVTPANPGNISIVGRQVSGTAINLLAGGGISLNASTASASVTGTGPMVVNAVGQLGIFGSGSGGFKAELSTTGSQTINVGSINMAAGSGGNWAFARIRADGDQQITTTNGGISLGGGGGNNYGGFALIEHGTGGGNQSISIDSVGLNLAGGSAFGTTVNPAEVALLVPGTCAADPACLAQPVTGALAFVSNRSGSQTVDFQNPGATLMLSGGTGGIRNAASVTHSGGGIQTISGAPDVTLAGGASGGNNYKTADGFHYLRNSATIFAPGAAQGLDFNTLTISSTGTGATGFGTAAIVGNGQTIDVAGALILAAGNTNAGGGAVVIQSTAGQTINAGGTTITGGGTGYDNIAAIRQFGSGAVGQNLSFASLSIIGGSGTGTAGDTGDCGVACAGHAASNHSGIYNAGALGQTVNTGPGAITLTGGSGGNRNNAYVQNRSSGLQSITAGSIVMQGGDSGGENSFWMFGQANVWGGSWLANSASITSGWSGGVVGAQNITSTGPIMVRGNSGGGGGSGMGGAGIASTGSQSITGTAISVLGGNGSAAYDSGARLISLGTQSISANSLAIIAGSTGDANRAVVSGYGQNITISGGILNVVGGGTSATDRSNSAEILNLGGSGQSIQFSAAAAMTVVGGAGAGFNPIGDNDCGAPCNNLGSENSARVRNESGFQTIDFQGGGSLTLTGGSNGNDNFAGIGNRSAGAQQILGNPAITLARGASGGVQVWAPSLVEQPGTRRWQEMTNDAGIDAEGAQTINASSITMNAGAGSAQGGLFISGLTQNITVAGALSMTGGAAGDAVNAPITGTGFDPVTEFLFKAPAVIGNDRAGHSLVLNVGSLSMTGGGYGDYGGSPVLIGTYKHATNLTINASAGINLMPATAGSVRIGSFGANGGGLTMAAGGPGMALGAAHVGTGNIGSVVLVTANGPLSQTSGGKIASHDVQIMTGSGAVAQPVGAAIDAFMLNAAGNNLSFLGDNLATSITLTSTGAGGGIAYNTAADAHIVSATAASGDILLTTTTLPAPFLGLGTITASAGNVTVTAERAILDDNGSALNITGQNIWLTSNSGGVAGGLAISMDTQASGWIKGKVSGGVGGIAIRNQGDFGPLYNASNFFELDDSLAANGNQVGFHTAGNLDMGGASFKLLTNNAGDAAASAGGDLSYNGGAVLQTNTGAPYGRVVLQAGNDLTVNGVLGAVNGSINLSAGSQLAIHQAVTATEDILLFAPLIDVTHAVSASGSIGVVGATVNISGIGSLSAAEVDVAASDLTMLGSGAEIWASAGDVRGIFLGHVTLNDGAHIKAPVGDVKLAFLGADSTLYLNDAPGYANPSYIMASPSTVGLAFTNRDSGGIVIDGSETATTVAGGSGFYTGGPPGVGTPLAEGAGLEIVYPNPVGREILAVIANAIERATDAVDSGSTPTEGDGLLQPGEGQRGVQDRAEGGGEGSFGEAENTDEKKDEKKDAKDKKKGEEEKDGKKDEKPGQKKVAQCT